MEITGLRSAQFATSFAAQFHADLTLLHVIGKHSKPFSVLPELAEENAREELSRLLPPTLEIFISVTVRVEHGKVGDIVPDVAKSVGASLIGTGFGNHSALGDHSPWSTLSEIIRSAPGLVLSVCRHLV